MPFRTKLAPRKFQCAENGVVDMARSVQVDQLLAERPSHLKQLVPGEKKDEHEQSTHRAVLVVKKGSVPLGARSSPDVKMD